MKRIIFFVLLLLASRAEAQTFYSVDSSEHVGSLLTSTIGSISAPPYWIHVTTGTGGYFARIGVPLLICLRDTNNDSAFYQVFEFDSVAQIVGDSLYVVKRALSNSLRYAWPLGTQVEVVNSGGIIADQIQDKVLSLIGLPDTSGHSGQWLTDSAAGIGPRWATITSSGSGVTSFNSRTGVVTPASGDYSFGQITSTAAVTQGGTGLTSIASGDMLYASAANTLASLVVGSGLSIVSDTLRANDIPDTTSKTNDVLTVLPTGVGWSPVGSGTVTSVDVSGGSSGLAFANGPITNTGTIQISGGQLAINYGGTGASSAIAAFTNLLPDTTGHTGQTLTTKVGGGYQWISTSGAGTVTSVGGSGGTTGLTLTGGPITAAGTLTIGGTLAVANGGTGQTSYTNGQILIGNTAGNTLTKATLTGTSNEVTVTNGGGAVTLSTPQDIGTSSLVQFGGVTTGSFTETPTTAVAINANTNDWALGTGAAIYRVANTAAGSVNVTGISSSGSQAGRIIRLVNVGTEPIVLESGNASSSAGNRFQTNDGGNIILASNGAATFEYDASNGVWQFLNSNN